MKKFLLSGVTMTVLLIVGYMWQQSRADKAAEAAQVTLSKVERGNLQSIVSTSGKVTPNLEVDIKCKASGRVINLPFEISDPVKKGDLLVELDPVDEQRIMRQAEVALNASKAQLAQAKQTLLVAQQNLETEKRKAALSVTSLKARAQDSVIDKKRAEEMNRAGIISPQDYDKALTSQVAATSDLETARTRLEELKTQEISIESRKEDVNLAKTQVELDELRLQEAKQRLEDTKVYSPIDGIVATRTVQKGMIISSGISNVGGGTTVMTLADLSRVFVLASVDESDIGRVAVGQTAKITADAFPTIPFTGRVERIATKGLNAYNVVTFEVKIEVLDERKSLLKPEMTTNVEILLEEKDDILTIPVEALVRKGDRRYAVVVKPDGATEERAVEIGMTDGIRYEVMSGLSEGETVQVRNDIADTKWSGTPSDDRTRQRGATADRGAGGSRL